MKKEERQERVVSLLVLLMFAREREQEREREREGVNARERSRVFLFLEKVFSFFFVIFFETSSSFPLFSSPALSFLRISNKYGDNKWGE